MKSLHSTTVSLLYILMLLPPTSLSRDDPYYTDCSTLLFSCGTIRNLGYPFWGNDRPGYCGRQGFQLDCHGDEEKYPVMRIGTLEYRVLNVSTGAVPTIRIARTDLWEGVCLQSLTNTTLDYTIFSNSASCINLTLLYDCPRVNYSVPNNFSCDPGQVGYYADESLLRIRLPSSEQLVCRAGVGVPILTTESEELSVGSRTLEEALNQGFDLVYHSDRPECAVCESSGGVCGSNLSSSSSSQFSCLCRHGQSPDYCEPPGNVKRNLNLKIGIAISVIGAVLIIISAFLIWRKYSRGNRSMFWKKKPENFKNIEVFLENFGSLCPKRFRYSDIKRITNSFKDKLGEGGFGGVYRGKLRDGRLVAVKVLKKLKGSGEDFINEVSSISRTSHINIVTLLGFCFEGRKRALVYEFMPNGSLEKFIYQKIPVTSERQLKWDTLYQIAIGIARGLEYLHRGCNTRILHFDIKPHNILLDEEFIPKISDFGLAKICPQKESIVSMLGARGTPGYIAPEVFSRNFGGVSHKSDVYSYGMMVLEMVGGRRNIDCEADRTSELYFPHWIYKRLELCQELGLQGIVEEDEKEKARKMIIVSMWCIQTNPSNRPPMSRVVEMLEGGLNSLQIPPQPFLSSPSRSPAEDSSFMASSSTFVI